MSAKQILEALAEQTDKDIKCFNIIIIYSIKATKLEHITFEIIGPLQAVHDKMILKVANILDENNSSPYSIHILNGFIKNKTLKKYPNLTLYERDIKLRNSLK